MWRSIDSELTLGITFSFGNVLVSSFMKFKLLYPFWRICLSKWCVFAFFILVSISLLLSALRVYVCVCVCVCCVDDHSHLHSSKSNSIWCTIKLHHHLYIDLFNKIFAFAPKRTKNIRRRDIFLPLDSFCEKYSFTFQHFTNFVKVQVKNTVQTVSFILWYTLHFLDGYWNKKRRKLFWKLDTIANRKYTYPIVKIFIFLTCYNIKIA